MAHFANQERNKIICQNFPDRNQSVNSKSNKSYPCAVLMGIDIKEKEQWNIWKIMSHINNGIISFVYMTYI